jgi:hypothetical protein
MLSIENDRVGLAFLELSINLPDNRGKLINAVISLEILLRNVKWPIGFNLLLMTEAFRSHEH